MTLETKLSTIKLEEREKGKNRLWLGLCSLAAGTFTGAMTIAETISLYNDIGKYYDNVVYTGGLPTLALAATAIYCIPKGIHHLRKARQINDTSIAQTSRTWLGNGYGDELFKEPYPKE